jgi:hypothetical protein
MPFLIVFKVVHEQDLLEEIRVAGFQDRDQL